MRILLDEAHLKQHTVYVSGHCYWNRKQEQGYKVHSPYERECMLNCKDSNQEQHMSRYGIGYAIEIALDENTPR